MMCLLVAKVALGMANLYALSAGVGVLLDLPEGEAFRARSN